MKNRLLIRENEYVNNDNIFFEEKANNLETSCNDWEEKYEAEVIKSKGLMELLALEK